MGGTTMIREWTRPTASGFLMLTVFLVFYALSGFGVFRAVRGQDPMVAIFWIFVFAATAVANRGLFVVNPNEGLVMQLFGAYRGTSRSAGLRWANPFYTKRSISLRVRNFESQRLKVNDTDGNPIEIAAV